MSGITVLISVSICDCVWSVFPRMFINLLLSPLFLMLILAQCCFSSVIAALATFMNKFLQQQYSATAAYSSLLVGRYCRRANINYWTSGKEPVIDDDGRLSQLLAINVNQCYSSLNVQHDLNWAEIFQSCCTMSAFQRVDLLCTVI